jgi:hypothetical protein
MDDSEDGSTTKSRGYHMKEKTVLNKWTASYSSVYRTGRGSRKDVSIGSRFMERKGRELIVVAITTDEIDDHAEPIFWSASCMHPVSCLPLLHDKSRSVC